MAMRQIHAHIHQRAFRTSDEKEEIDKYFRERKKVLEKIIFSKLFACDRNNYVRISLSLSLSLSLSFSFS